MVVRPATGSDGSTSAAVAVLTCDRIDLLFCVFFAAVSDSGVDRSGRDSAGVGISRERCEVDGGGSVLVCADGVLAVDEFAHVDGGMLGRACGVGAGCFQSFSADVVVRLLRWVSFVRCGCGGVCGLQIGWDVAGGRVHRAVSGADGISAWACDSAGADSREYFSALVGVGSHLFRVRRSEDREWRPGVAAFHGDGRVLPEWSAADVDWLVPPAFSALVSCGDGVSYAGVGTGARLHGVSAAALADRLFFHRDALATRRNSYGELHVSELFGFGAGNFPAGRSFFAAVYSGAVEG